MADQRLERRRAGLRAERHRLADLAGASPQTRRILLLAGLGLEPPGPHQSAREHRARRLGMAHHHDAPAVLRERRGEPAHGIDAGAEPARNHRQRRAGAVGARRFDLHELRGLADRRRGAPWRGLSVERPSPNKRADCERERRRRRARSPRERQASPRRNAQAKARRKALGKARRVGARCVGARCVGARCVGAHGGLHSSTPALLRRPLARLTEDDGFFVVTRARMWHGSFVI